HAVADRMRGVDLNVENRPRREMLIARRAALQIADRYREVLDSKPGRRPERDQRSAGIDELLQRRDPLLPDAAAIFGPDRGPRASVHDLLRILIRKDDGVEPLLEIAGTHIVVVNCG